MPSGSSPPSLCAADAVAPVVARILGAAAAGSGAVAADATQALLRLACTPAQVTAVVGAALDLDDADFLEAAVALAIGADLPGVRRIHLAWRLAIGGKVHAAMAVLLSDPGILAQTERIKQVVVTLMEVERRAGPKDPAGHQARALIRRLIPLATPYPLPCSHAFGGDPSAAPNLRGAPVVVHAAAAVPPSIRQELAQVLARFDRAVARQRHPEVTMLEGVFVNRKGQLWNRDGAQYRNYGEPLPDASRRAMLCAPVIEEAALAVEAHNNTYHWFAEWFPTLAWHLDDAQPRMPVLVRDDAARFVTESLTLGAAGEVATVAVGDAVFVRRLYVADRGLLYLARPEAVGGLIARLRERSLAAHPGIGGARPVYVSRKDSRKRRMVNEDALEAALAQRGFNIVQLSTLGFAEQLALLCRAPMIVGAHGAGLALLAAAFPGRQVLEIVPALRGGMELRSVMAKISRIVGHSHEMWLQDAPDPHQDWQVALDPVLARLDAMSTQG